MKAIYQWSAVAISAFLLTACGGSSSSGDKEPPSGGGDKSGFTEKATWNLTPAANQSYCFDFDGNAEVACDNSNWDLKFSMGTRTPSLYTNSGSSGAGKGGALGGPFDYSWEQLSKFKNGLTDDQGGTLVAAAYLKDALNNAFSGTNMIGSNFLEYGLSGHLLLPNFRVFLVTPDNSKKANEVAPYAVQVIGYYGGASGSTSGYPTLRWIKLGDAEGTQQTATINASGNDWVYFDLENNTTVDAPDANNWHIAFNRYNVKTNSGSSGSGKVGSFTAATADGFYDADGKPIAAQFLSETASADTLALLFDSSALLTPAAASNWLKDSIKSSLNAAFTGSYPNPLSYGWYTYYPTDDSAANVGLVKHMLKANPENGALLKSAEGDSYARFHITEISYADPNSGTSQTSWKIEFDVQPAAEK